MKRRSTCDGSPGRRYAYAAAAKADEGRSAQQRRLILRVRVVVRQAQRLLPRRVVEPVGRNHLRGIGDDAVVGGVGGGPAGGVRKLDEILDADGVSLLAHDGVDVHGLAEANLGGVGGGRYARGARGGVGTVPLVFAFDAAVGDGHVDVGQRLGRGPNHRHLAGARWEQVDLLRGTDGRRGCEATARDARVREIQRGVRGGRARTRR